VVDSKPKEVYQREEKVKGWQISFNPLKLNANGGRIC
jgi:hypothetical protein